MEEFNKLVESSDVAEDEKKLWLDLYEMLNEQGKEELRQLFAKQSAK